MNEKQYVHISKKTLVLLAVLPNFFTLLMSLMSLKYTPRLEAIYNSVIEGEPISGFEGEPISGLAHLFFNSYEFLCILPVALITLALVYYKN